MRVRHRTPSIFSLSMVDVLCCALGCVILLWLLNLREAKQRSLEAGESNDHLTAARAAIDRLLAEQRSDRDRLARTEDDLEAARKRASDLDARLSRAGEEAAARGQRIEELISLRDKAESRVKMLGPVAALVPALQADLKNSRDKLADEEALARVLQSDLEARKRELAVATKELKDLAVASRKLRDDVESRDQALADARAVQERLTRAEDRIKSLDQESATRKKDLATAERIIDGLQTDKRNLVAEAGRMRAAVENRFEGIALTGKRVIFLVDMSGSMDLVDETTPAPLKWSGVRDAVARLLKSLSDLERFQVIVFSERASFLLGRDGDWLDYDAKRSVDEVTRALAAVRPKGGTNMYTALDAAFRYRASGLDTIYLLSDGLPNLGEGLTPEQERTMKESEKGEVLGRTIRRTLHNAWNRETAGKRVRINTVGFFYESPEVGAFLWALARENDGSFVGMSKP
jgi:hypothetical protein